MHQISTARARSARSWTVFVSAALALALCACTVRLIADYDQYSFDKVTALQEQCEKLFVSLEEAAATPDKGDDLYQAHAAAYDEIIASLRVLETRAQTLDKNEIPQEQVRLLRDSMERMQALHREKSSAEHPEGFSKETITTLREPIVQQFRAILTLQAELKRGK